MARDRVLTDMPVLSVVIPVYNGERHLPVCLESLWAQSRSDFEIVLVDDGSTDGSGAIADRFAARADGPELRIVRQPNAGVSAARNRGMREARADLVGFLDCDDLWYREKVALQVEAMATNPDIDLCFTGFRIVDDAGHDLLERSVPSAGPMPIAKLMPRNTIHTSTVVARRAALLATGGFDEALATFEDFDLWLRVGALRDPGILALPDCLCDYRRHATQTTKDWHGMHKGWQQVAHRIERDHPELWEPVRAKAWSHNLEYCASLAYNAGDIPQMRELMREALGHATGAILRRPDGVIMTGVMVCSYLPRPVQLVIGYVFKQTRRCKRWVESKRARTSLDFRGSH